MTTVSVKFSSPKEVSGAFHTNEELFRYCSFESTTIEGGDSDGTFITCKFQQFEWYWGLFNMALFVGCKFNGCTFQGTSFAGCRFVECSFVGCRFLPDNLGGSCTATDTKLYGCTSQDCEGFNEVFKS